MSLHRLLYLSTARPDLAYPDLRDIMAKSEVNNERDGITGILCFGNNRFVQALEGSRKMISETYARILNDPRHTDPELVEFGPIDCRYFTKWSMRLIQWDRNEPAAIRDIRMKYCSGALFDPSTMNAQQCLNLLMDMHALSG